MQTPGVLFTKGRTQEILRRMFVRKFYAWRTCRLFTKLCVRTPCV